MNRLVIITAALIIVSLCIVLANEPIDVNDVNTPDSVQTPVKRTIRPEVIYRQFNRRINKLEDEVLRLGKDNRDLKMQADSLQRQIDILSDNKRPIKVQRTTTRPYIPRSERRHSTNANR
jgi:hypothetical protein